jgi:F-type H+-transporting ATPase subunit b
MYNRLLKELAKMEAEVFQLQQRVKYSQEIRGTLDSWVRHEAQARADQQRLLVENVVAGVEASLKQPKLYDMVMQQTLTDVEGLILAGVNRFRFAQEGLKMCGS